MDDGCRTHQEAIRGGCRATPSDGHGCGHESARAPGLDWSCGVSVLVVSGEPRLRRLLHGSLAPRFALVETAGDAATAEALLARCHFDLLISALHLPERPAPEWVRELRSRGTTLDVLFVAKHNDPEGAAGVLDDGRSCLIVEPFEAEQLLVAVRRCTTGRKAPHGRRTPCVEGQRNRPEDLIVGASAPIRRLCRLIERVAPTPSTLLVQGETGTGKDVAARAIHANSGRSGSFVAVNCGALPRDLLESELFGHVKGAFTGAHQTREGLFKHAHGGTLFLDEISEMPAPMQAKLLRVLEERTVRPVGTNQEIPVDVRIVAATHRDLEQQVAAGRFRGDLFYRLSVVALRVPTLRERAEDIALLARHFLAILAAAMGLPVPSYGDAELQRLGRYAWPGNVRELRNVIERSLLLDCLPSGCLREAPVDAPSLHQDEPCDLRLATLEQRHIRSVLQRVNGNKSQAARQLGISRKTLERKVKAWADQSPTGV